MSKETKYFKEGKFDPNSLDNAIMVLGGLIFALLNPDKWLGGAVFSGIGIFGKPVLMNILSNFSGGKK